MRLRRGVRDDAFTFFTVLIVAIEVDAVDTSPCLKSQKVSRAEFAL